LRQARAPGGERSGRQCLHPFSLRRRLRHNTGSDFLCSYGGTNCSAEAASLAEFRKLEPGFEKNGVEIDQSPRSVLKGPDLGNFELQHDLANAPANDLLPADVRALLGWNEAEAKTPGAYPLE